MLTTSLAPWEGIVKGKFQGNCVCCHVDGLNQTDQFKEDASLIYAMYHQHDNISRSLLGPLVMELSKESSKEIVDVVMLMV